MKLLTLSIVFVFLAGCGHSFFDDEYVLGLSKPSTFILRTDSKSVSEFRFRAQGTSSAEGVLELYLEDTVYKTQKISGKTQFDWAGDWYHPNMKLVYKVKKKGKGTLKIKYKIGYALL